MSALARVLVLGFLVTLLALPTGESRAGAALPVTPEAPDQSASAATGPSDAAAFVEALGNRASEIMRAPVASESARRAALHDLLAQGLGIDAMSRHIVGAHWTKASAGQRDAFRDAFQQYLVTRMVSFLDMTAPEDFRAVSGSRISSKASRITTEVTRLGLVVSEIDWVVLAEGGRQEIADIVSNGVSLSATYRDEFRSFVNRQGMDALTSVLLRKVASN
jgi:ABC-type transporter MlaC component